MENSQRFVLQHWWNSKPFQVNPRENGARLQHIQTGQSNVVTVVIANYSFRQMNYAQASSTLIARRDCSCQLWLYEKTKHAFALWLQHFADVKEDLEARWSGRYLLSRILSEDNRIAECSHRVARVWLLLLQKLQHWVGGTITQRFYLILDWHLSVSENHPCQNDQFVKQTECFACCC
jgi:hypothetical protein